MATITNNTDTKNSLLCQDYFNFISIGDEGVGKTSLFIRFCTKKFATEKKKPKPIDLFKKTFTHKSTDYFLKCWDIQYSLDSFKLNKSMYDRADCIMIMCSIDNRKSFESIQTWHQMITDNIDITGKQIILISNKTDLEDAREVGLDELKQKSEELDIDFFETSAKNDTGINDVFDIVLEKIINVIYKEDTKELKADEHTNSSGAGCMG